MDKRSLLQSYRLDAPLSLARELFGTDGPQALTFDQRSSGYRDVDAVNLLLRRPGRSKCKITNPLSRQGGFAVLYNQRLSRMIESD